jgi:hypothetical protein
MSMRSAPARAVIVAVIALAAMTNGGSAQQPARGFGGYFSDKTMRVDYFHSGGVGQEIVALDRVVSDAHGRAAAPASWMTRISASTCSK